VCTLPSALDFFMFFFYHNIRIRDRTPNQGGCHEKPNSNRSFHHRARVHVREPPRIRRGTENDRCRTNALPGSRQGDHQGSFRCGSRWLHNHRPIRRARHPDLHRRGRQLHTRWVYSGDHPQQVVTTEEHIPPSLGPARGPFIFIEETTKK